MQERNFALKKRKKKRKEKRTGEKMAIVESQKIDQKLSQILGLDRKNQKAIALSSIDSDEHQIGAPTPASAPIHERDLLSQFKMNLDKVESLNRRLKFVLGEVEQVMRKY